MTEVLKYENLKYFFVALLLSLPFWLGVNLFWESLDDIFFWQEISKNPGILTAQLNLKIPLGSADRYSPGTDFGIDGIKDLDIKADSVISVWLDNANKEEILFEKDKNTILPIASLTKLMTAYIVLEHYPDISQEIEISKEAVFQAEDTGYLRIGERLLVKNLLYIMLIESSNDAAFALTEIIGQKGFVNLMNVEAKFLGMENTYFTDPHGVSYQNRSNTEDLVILTKKLLEYPLIWEILQKSEFDLYKENDIFHHKLINTNKLLGEIPNILGGKTGFLPETKENFLLALKIPGNQEYIINVILGTDDRFREMKNLISYLDLF